MASAANLLLTHPKLSVQQPGAVLAHGHSGFVVFFSWLCCNSVQPPKRVKHGLQNLDASQLAVLDAFTAFCAQVSTALPPTFHLGLALGIGWEAWERSEDGGRE